MDYAIMRTKLLLEFKGLQMPVQFLNKMKRKKQKKNESVDSFIYEKLSFY